MNPDRLIGGKSHPRLLQSCEWNEIGDGVYRISIQWSEAFLNIVRARQGGNAPLACVLRSRSQLNFQVTLP